MVNPIISGTGKMFGSVFGMIFKIKVAYILVAFVLIQTIIIGLGTGNPLGIVESLGDRFLGITQRLQATSLDVIQNGVTGGIFDFGSVLWNLFIDAYLIYLWLKLLKYAIGEWTPLSDNSHGFTNFILGALFFFIIQIVYLQVFMGPLPGQTRVDLLLTPFAVFVDFFKAVFIILTTVSFDSLVGGGSSNICVDPAGCVV